MGGEGARGQAGSRAGGCGILVVVPGVEACGFLGGAAPGGAGDGDAVAFDGPVVVVDLDVVGPAE
jgi:hypothetical protein